MKFSAATQAWLNAAFKAPTLAQTQAWDAISAANHTLVVAPTGSGKTLAAFLWAIDAHLRETTGTEPQAPHPGRILYVSPLKALASDVERNLRAPLIGIQQQAVALGLPPVEVSVATRTGDTSAAERRRIQTHPPDILITTPESLFLMLTSATRSVLSEVTTVIIDEIHALAGTKRGAHLSLSLERLDALLDQPAQRIGLSATVTPSSTVGEFLAGARSLADGGRPLEVVQPKSAKQRVIELQVPVEDLTNLPRTAASGKENGEGAAGALGADSAEFLDLTGDATGDPNSRGSLWPHLEVRLVDLIAAHRSTLVFVNSRRTAERLTARINEEWARRSAVTQLNVASDASASPGTGPAAIPGQSGVSHAFAGPPIARAHHGSMSAGERRLTEEALKLGQLPAVVATSSLELGIDMGAVDLVVMVGAPPSVASGLQRLGRAGHGVGEVSHGVVLPTHRGELISASVTAGRMLQGELESIRVPHNALDILAQQIVAMVSMEDLTVHQLEQVVRRAYGYRELPHNLFHAVLNMLAGRFPSQDFSELRPRLEWDRTTDVLQARPGAQRLAVTSGGTIPDRGLYPVVLAGSHETTAGRSTRVGELDEEMVYESRVGDVITLGSSSWRITDITPQQVIVTPQPGAPARLPFWKGEGPGRPFELGKAIGAWVAKIETMRRTDQEAAVRELTELGLDAYAQQNLLALLAEQQQATEHLPTDKTILIERFRDEVGDWRVVVHSPFGGQVHAPWALVIRARIQERYGLDASVAHSDDGIVLRMPPAGEDFDLDLDLGELLIEPDAVTPLVREHITDSVMFAARFREAAARALLLPKKNPTQRQPLWQQRHRAAQLLQVAARFPDFPIVFEAIRECLQDDMDLPALGWLMTQIANRRIRVVEVETPAPSPMARALLFGYTAQFLYDGDAPLAERRALALSLDPTLLAEIMGQAGAPALSELLDPQVLAEVTAEVMRTAAQRQVTTAPALWDLLRSHGPLSLAEIQARAQLTEPEITEWLALNSGKLVISVRLAGQDQLYWCAVDDAAKLRDALGTPLPAGLASVYLEPVSDPLAQLLRQYASSNGPFTPEQVAARFGITTAQVSAQLQVLLVSGHLAPGPDATVVDTQVLRRIKRRTLAKLRGEVEAVDGPSLARFIGSWQQLGQLRGREGLASVIEQLAGVPLPASALETHILPARVTDYTPALLDELLARGEVLWAGHQRLPGAGGDALISLHPATTAQLTLADTELPSPDAALPDSTPTQELHTSLLNQLAGGGQFLDTLVRVSGYHTSQVAQGLWQLVWQGKVTCDNPAAWRELISKRGGGHRVKATIPRSRQVSPAGPIGSRLSLRAVMQAAQSPVRHGVAGAEGAASGKEKLPEANPGEVAAARAGGRWSLLPKANPDPRLQAHADATILLQRYGVISRNLVGADQLRTPAAAVFACYRRWEEEGLVRRGYFVEKNGGTQYALAPAVEELRRHSATGPTQNVQLLAATDPANPYGLLLPWPQTEHPHRAARRAGAVVILVDGHPVLFSERSGHTLLTAWDSQLVAAQESASLIQAAVQALVAAVKSGKLNRLTIKRIDAHATLELVKLAQRPTQPQDPAHLQVTRELLSAGAVIHTQGLALVGPHARR